MFWKFTNRKVGDAGALFNGHFIEVKAFYVMTFDVVPCVHFINELDVTQAYGHIRKGWGREIRATYQHSYFEYSRQALLFNNTIFILDKCRMIELANGYAHILFTPGQYAWAHRITKDLAAFRKAVPEITRNRVIGFARQTEPG